MKTATLQKATPDPEAEEAARAARLANTRRRVRELIDNDPEFAAMIAAAATAEDDTPDPELELSRSTPPSAASRAATLRLRQELLRRKGGSG
jgi:hypothetical protein